MSMQGEGKAVWSSWLLANLVKDPFQLIVYFHIYEGVLMFCPIRLSTLWLEVGLVLQALGLLYVFV